MTAPSDSNASSPTAASAVDRPTPETATVVIFGASGDLTARKLLPALFDLWSDGYLSDNAPIVGHPLTLTDVGVTLAPDPELPGVRVEAVVRTIGKTGVEMEALTAVTVALLTIYDMAKAIDRGMTIGDISLAEKTGGASGAYARA